MKFKWSTGSSNNGEVLVSVIVPVCNVAKYLPNCLDSICGQTLNNIEIICVDDCSRDSSAKILKDYAARDSRVIPIYHSENLSTSQARKDGVAASRGRYIMFVDGDDELHPQACEIAYRAIGKYRTDMVQFGTEIINCAGVPKERIEMNQKLLEPYMEGEINEENLVGACWTDKFFGYSLWNKIYKGDICRRAFQQVKDGSFPKAQDLYAFFLIAYNSRSYRGIEDQLYRYKFGLGVTGSNYISTAKFDVLLTEKKVWEALVEFAQQQGELEKYQSVLDTIADHFLGDCTGRWARNLQIENLSEAFQHLIDVWGMDKVISKLAEQNWEKAAGVAEKLAQVELFTHKKHISGYPRTVAMYYRSIKNGGAQRVAAELCNIWAEMVDETGNPLYKVILITDEEEEKNSIKEYSLDPRVKRDCIPAVTKLTEGLYSRRYQAWERVIREHGIDIVVTGMWVDPCILWDILSVKGQPSHPAFVIHCHSFTCAPYRFMGDKFAELIYDYRISNGVVTLSEADQRLVSCFTDYSKCISNPISFTVDSTVITERKDNTIVWAGRISPEKQPFDAAYMMAHVVKKIPDARLYMIGQGNENVSKELEDLIEQLGIQDNLILTGFTSKVEKYYSTASVFVGTSEYEGFSMVFCEAMAHGVPVVTYDLPWLTLTRDGRGIISVPQKRPDLLAKEVIKLLEDPKLGEEIGLKGREQVQDLEKTDLGEQWDSFFTEISSEGEENQNRNPDEVETVLLKYMTLYAKIGKDAKIENLEKRIQSLRRTNKKLKEKNKAVKRTVTFRIGKAIMFVPRLIVKLLKSLIGKEKKKEG